MTTRRQFLARLAKLSVFQRGGVRAPHKPLLLLFALGRVHRRDERLVGYLEVDRRVGELLREYGPAQRTSASYPFWHLQSDELWFVAEAPDVPLKKGGRSPAIGYLKEHNTHGGFPQAVHQLLAGDEDLQRQAASVILQLHFPRTIHEELLESVGLPAEWTDDPIRLPAAKGRRARRSGFRAEVLEAYRQRCAVCGFDVRVAGHAFGLDAAHVMWHQADGPDEVTNGLALCALHHRALDRGVIGFDDELLVLVSSRAIGTQGFDEHFLAHRGQRLREPKSKSQSLELAHVDWHRREVFRGAPLAST